MSGLTHPSLESQGKSLCRRCALTTLSGLGRLWWALPESCMALEPWAPS